MVKTKEIAEAAIFYLNGLEMVAYDSKFWSFDDPDKKSESLQMELINKKLRVEPLEFMDAIRRVKSFSNGMKNKS
jgi:hypothetical protein